jgi:hypothetical protein
VAVSHKNVPLLDNQRFYLEIPSILETQNQSTKFEEKKHV